MKDYLPAVQWMRDNGVPTAKRFDGIMTIGTMWQSIESPKSQWVTGYRYQVSNQNIPSSRYPSKSYQVEQSKCAFHTHLGALANSEIAWGAGSTAIGAITCQNTPNSPSTYYEVPAKLVVLATGGFQGSPDITSKYLGQGGENMFVRSNRGSVGDGLNMAIESGTGTSRGMNTYYGHLLPAPLGLRTWTRRIIFHMPNIVSPDPE
jgi:hypothetical protein